MTPDQITINYPEQPRFKPDGMTRLIPGMQFKMFNGDIATVRRVGTSDADVWTEKLGVFVHFMWIDHRCVV